MASDLLFKTAYFNILASEKNEFFTAILKLFDGLRTHLESLIAEMSHGGRDGAHPAIDKLFRLLSELAIDFDPEASALHKAMYLARSLRDVMELNEQIRSRFASKHEEIDIFTEALRDSIKGVVPILTQFYEQNTKTLAI